ncbi:4Fe-4S dicluster domain-containing protein [Planctomycetota bacterium]
MAERKGMLIDVTRCMGCRACQVACKQWNQLPATKTRQTGTYQNPPALSGDTWTLVNFVEPDDGDVRWLFRKDACNHCGDPTCVEVCPTGACKKREDGIVFIDQDLCAGCKYCVETCPFNIPHPDHRSGNARKCRMCLDRVDSGLAPACATACPTDAVQFGDRKAMLYKAKARIAELKGLDAEKYAKVRLYGETELDGLGVMYILPEIASNYNLPVTPKKPTGKIFAKWLFGIIPGLAILAGLGRYLWKQTSAPAKAETGGDK